MPKAEAISRTASVCSEMSTGPSTTFVFADRVSRRVPASARKSCVASRAAPWDGRARETSGRIVVAVAMVFPVVADLLALIFLYWLPEEAAIVLPLEQQGRHDG